MGIEEHQVQSLENTFDITKPRKHNGDPDIIVAENIKLNLKQSRAEKKLHMTYFG